MSRFIKEYLFPVIMLIIFSACGYWLANNGFDSVKQMRQLERVPATKVGAILPGEVNITATAVKYKSTVSSFYTHTPSLYYLYTEEVEETDSDGNTSWKTINTVSKSVDFYVSDQTGNALVNRGASRIDWSMPESFQVIKGDYRYTEYRLEENDTVFIFGMGNLIQDQPVINFINAGEYTPIISKYSEAEERSDMGVATILKIWLGITFMSLCVYFVAYLFKIHRLIKYLSILTFVLAFILIDMGLVMMQEDLKGGLARYNQQEKASIYRVEQLLERDGVTFSGWSELYEMNNFRYNNLQAASKEKTNEIRLNLLFARQQLIRQMEAFPEKWLTGLWGMDKPEKIVVPLEVKKALQLRIKNYQPSRLSKLWPLIFTLVGIVLAVVFSWFGIRQVKLKRYIENIPTSSTSGVVYGVCEVKGRLIIKESGDSLSSPLTKSSCSWFHYLVEERRGSGKNARWVTIEENTESIDFYCEDNDGKVQIDIDNAEIITKHCEVNRRGSRRYTEKTLRLNDELYVIGYANLNNQLGSNLAIGYSSEREPFIVSNRTENEVMISKARLGIFNLNMAFSSVVLASLLLFGMAGGFAATDFLMSALIAPLFMLLIMIILHYNDIVFLKQRVERNKSNIQVSLKKRYNLLPNIEVLVKEYAKHEADVFKEVIEFRTLFKKSIKDINKLDDLSNRQKKIKISINSLQEKYPELKSNQLFEKMMDVINAIENELMYMRVGYNDAVEVYNTRIQSIPDVVLANMFDFNEEKFIVK
ncbi:MAG: hypothetical protein DIZ80_11160 [endosymbiont of Galathealinum brachiosum]|uniref:RING-type E3 ubiquitin transferase n=1 Tax=endosymbiont of Galathealinum brachiosum TaxID=2200906 RepID=A0A370DD91_9GAMM|nr:MAG: hypothetical protein DIZ80_11160 [endosymbiont of Galathealinum brachiosum]